MHIYILGGKIMIVIDSEFRKLIPPLASEEYQQLKANIEKDGCREPLVMWGDLLVDGHNRLRICENAGLPYKTIQGKFKSRESVKMWIITNQLGRRNLTPFQRAELALRLKPLLSQEAKERQFVGRHLDQNSDHGRTLDTIAHRAGLSHDTIHKAEYILNNADEGTQDALRGGETTIHREYTSLRKPHLSQCTGQNEWYTPSQYIEAARQVLGEIDLDPASNPFANEVVKANHFFTKEDDGLTKDWTGKVWLNPPYEKGLIDKFIDKAIAECKEAIILTHNSTDTKWFQSLASKASAICFTSGRIQFYSDRPDKSGPLQGQAFSYIGSNTSQFISVFKRFGFCVEVCRD
jgi:phage N-6-adenine-methyltransferase